MFEILKDFTITLITITLAIVAYVQVVMRFYYFVNRLAKGLVVDNGNGLLFVVIFPFFMLLFLLSVLWDMIKQSILFLVDKEYYVECQGKNSFIVPDKFYSNKTIHSDDK